MEFSKPEVVAAVSFLLASIGGLWAIIKANAKRDLDDLKDCRKSRDEATKEIKDLHGKYNYLQGRMDGVENLSRSVLDKLEERRKTDESL